MEWGMIKMNSKRSQLDVSEFDKYADTYVIKTYISETIQIESDVKSILPLLMMSMCSEYKMMDAMYTPVNKVMTPIPNLRIVVDWLVFSLETRNPMMHVKYSTMHESKMMEETARRFVATTSSTPYLMMHPAIGKNTNDFSSVSLVVGIV